VTSVSAGKTELGEHRNLGLEGRSSQRQPKFSSE